MTPLEPRTRLVEIMMNQRKYRILPPEMRNRVMANRVMANDVLLQQVARMEPKPEAMENNPI
jgi:hypothetical protein